ncbi:hypothetical protein DdX_20755 [Ditylenchus destructor]|uniref:Uncharacterized protein n=1 Tax=Ditylenchus destructor TaxID=166010 RepID=A0AAD4MGR8_9BILA|nr:hypothetical protein DdX_20755 [Ditylenchus destructor]
MPVPITPQSVAGPLPEDNADAQTVVGEQSPSLRSKSRSMTSSDSQTILPVPPPGQPRSPSMSPSRASRHTGRSHTSRSLSSSASSSESRKTKNSYHSFSALPPGEQYKLKVQNGGSIYSQQG